ncbi:hypothetical protein DIE11_23885 [Burkholderia sp. Bp9012]|nr:hypothetical protein DIE11_23885 [Burkholderia sp. Bp9012]
MTRREEPQLESALVTRSSPRSPCTLLERSYYLKLLFGRRRAVVTNTSAQIAPKYRDRKSGAPCNGHGRKPQWIEGVKGRDRFLSKH